MDMELKVKIILLEKRIKNMPYKSIRRENALIQLKLLYEKLHHMYFS